MNDEQIDSVLDNAPDMPIELATKIRARIQQSVQPVRPMASTTFYSFGFLILFGLISVLYASILNFAGLKVLSAGAAGKLLTTFCIGGLFAANAVAVGMRPAAGRLHSWLLVVLSLLTYEVLVISLFADYSTEGFIHHGMACLSLGVLGGMFVAAPIWLIARRGFIVYPVLTGAAVGLVGGLAGLTALTLHCSLLTVPHTAVWHAGIVVVCVVAGAIAGRSSLTFGHAD